MKQLHIALAAIALFAPINSGKSQVFGEADRSQTGRDLYVACYNLLDGDELLPDDRSRGYKKAFGCMAPMQIMIHEDKWCQGDKDDWRRYKRPEGLDATELGIQTALNYIDYYEAHAEEINASKADSLNFFIKASVVKWPCPKETLK